MPSEDVLTTSAGTMIASGFSPSDPQMGPICNVTSINVPRIQGKFVSM